MLGGTDAIIWAVQMATRAHRDRAGEFVHQAVATSKEQGPFLPHIVIHARHDRVAGGTDTID